MNIGSPEPSELFAKIDACPPLMRGRATKPYIGRTVDWRVTFRNGYAADRGRAWLIFGTQPNASRMVTGTASLSKYPDLKSLLSGEIVRIRGRIRKIDALCVELDIAELELPNLVEAAH